MDADEEEEAVMQFWDDNGLQSASDFRYAFSSRAEAAAAGGPVIATAWQKMVDAALRMAPLPSSLRQYLPGVPRMRQPVKVEPAAVVPKPLPAPVLHRRKIRQPSDAKDAEARKVVAEKLVRLALSWGNSGSSR